MGSVVSMKRCVETEREREHGLVRKKNTPTNATDERREAMSIMKVKMNHLSDDQRQSFSCRTHSATCGRTPSGRILIPISMRSQIHEIPSLDSKRRIDLPTA